MDRTAVKINVRDFHGRKDAITLDAAIDGAIRENIILEQLFKRLKPPLDLESTPTRVKTFTDSNGAHYTASHTVTLLIGQAGRNWTTEAVFYISESQEATPGGGNRILLANSLRERFTLPRADGRESVGVAPTLLCYKDPKDQRQRKEDAEKKKADLRRVAKENQEKLDQERKERRDRERDDRENAQSNSTA
ncbi:hypothetical protein BJX63DRAFT_396542 [Aspergillus granulosus]|uniref:Uncharacterized protein n=1 Tax=Aspergillus granulosus TaxID=176169 RepID=A0ABR4HAK8_9EURO